MYNSKPVFLPVYAIIFLLLVSLAACTSKSSSGLDKPEPAKPSEYVPSVNLLALASSDSAELQKPWNAKDATLLSMARAIPPQSNVPGAIPGLPPGVFPDSTTETVIACPGGGTQTSINENVSPPWFSQGDTNTTVYDNCVRGDTTINGSRITSVDVMIGQQFIDPDWKLETSLTRDITRSNNLTGESSAVKGFSSESMEVTNSTNFRQITNGDWTSIRPNNGVEVSDIITYTINYAWEETPGGSYQWDFEVQASSTNPMLGSSSTVSLQTLTGLNNQAPETGKIKIIKTFSDTSSVTYITALGSGAVLIETDTDNDGVIDTSVESTWSQVMLNSILYQYF